MGQQTQSLLYQRGVRQLPDIAMRSRYKNTSMTSSRAFRSRASRMGRVPQSVILA
jgi:hypothetical protein